MSVSGELIVNIDVFRSTFDKYSDSEDAFFWVLGLMKHSRNKFSSICESRGHSQEVVIANGALL